MSEVTVSTFDELASLVLESGRVVALFTAPEWCGPCQRLEPHWNKVVDTLDEITFVKVDMGATPEDTGQHWASDYYGIRGVPQIKAFNGLVDNPADITARAAVPLIRELTQ